MSPYECSAAWYVKYTGPRRISFLDISPSVQKRAKKKKKRKKKGGWKYYLLY